MFKFIIFASILLVMANNASPLDKNDDNTIQEICTVLTGNLMRKLSYQI
jgi:hypothetical protein